MNPTIPWYKSKIIVGIFISALTKLLVLTGLTGEFTDADNQQLVDIIVLLAGGVGDLIAFGARVTQTHAPSVTLTKK